LITYTAAQTGTLWDPYYEAPWAKITVSQPTFSALDSDGDTPQFGAFATFTVTVTDISTTANNDWISPGDDDFYVQLPNGQKYGVGNQAGVQNGNSWQASLANELGQNPAGGAAITLYPGQSTTGTIVIDMPQQSGQIVYTGGGQVDGAWTF
jgi:hypothetical protein